MDSVFREIKIVEKVNGEVILTVEQFLRLFKGIKISKSRSTIFPLHSIYTNLTPQLPSNYEETNQYAFRMMLHFKYPQQMTLEYHCGHNYCMQSTDFFISTRHFTFWITKHYENHSIVTAFCRKKKGMLINKL